jgi:hypothetical protein
MALPLLDQARPHPLPRSTAAQIIVAFFKACHMEAVGGGTRICTCPASARI